MTNAWLQVTVLAHANTNLQSPDVFYFGNAVGDSGDSPTDAMVNATDQIEVRANAGTGVPITDPYDYNRDGNVDTTDELVARQNQTYFLSALQLITVPGIAGLLPTDEAANSPASSSSAVPGAVLRAAFTLAAAAAIPALSRWTTFRRRRRCPDSPSRIPGADVCG